MGGDMSACTAERFGAHDYSQPPHSTPDAPADAPETWTLADSPCQAQSARPPLPPCEHERRYEIVIYMIGSHEWIRMYACAPCTAALRVRHARLGPGGSQGIARIHDHEAVPALPGARMAR